MQGGLRKVERPPFPKVTTILPEPELLRFGHLWMCTPVRWETHHADERKALDNQPQQGL